MAQLPHHRPLYSGYLDLEVTEICGLLRSRGLEVETRNHVTEAPGTAKESSTGSHPQAEGHCPASADQYWSVLDQMLDGPRGEHPKGAGAGSCEPPAPSQQDPALVSPEKPTCAEAWPSRDTAVLALLPAPLPAQASQGEGERTEAVGCVKTKTRSWVRFSTFQRQALTDHFKVNRHLTANDAEALAAQLHLSPSQVRNWFRNERKKYRKWFAHLLHGEPEADRDTLRSFTERMSLRTGPGSMAHRLLKD